MQPAIHAFTHRMTLLLMLLTFLSPSFGWQMVANHEQLVHGPQPPDFSAHAHDHCHHGDKADEVAGHDHEDAHSMIGHLLGHMPASLLARFQLHLARQRDEAYPEPPSTLFFGPSDLPYRPPQSLPV